MTFAYRSLWLGVVLCSLLACKLDQRSDHPAHFPRCEVTRTDQVTIDDETPVGSAAERLAPYLGTRTCTWTWLRVAPPASIVAEPGEVAATVAVELTSDEAIFLKNEVFDQDPESPRSCPSHLETGLNLRITTEDAIVDAEVSLNLSVFENYLYTDPSVDLALLGIDVSWDDPWTVDQDVVAITFKADGSIEGAVGEFARSPDGGWALAEVAGWSCPAP